MTAISDVAFRTAAFTSFEAPGGDGNALSTNERIREVCHDEEEGRCGNNGGNGYLAAATWAIEVTRVHSSLTISFVWPFTSTDNA